MSELLPCPFCGGDNLDCTNGMGEHWVLCLDCKSSAEMTGSKETAIAAWNRRQPISELTEIQKGAINVAECFAEQPAMISDMAWSAAMRELLKIIAHLTGRKDTV